MKQLEVSILGQAYVLACPPGGEVLLREAVATVDREMVGIRDAGKVRARERIAVLAALNLAYQLAEREAAKPAAEAPAVGPVGAPNGPASSMPEAGTLDIDALIRRVDAALGEDGRLL
jgi:cell division protein ZapA